MRCSIAPGREVPNCVSNRFHSSLLASNQCRSVERNRNWVNPNPFYRLKVAYTHTFLLTISYEFLWITFMFSDFEGSQRGLNLISSNFLLYFQLHFTLFFFLLFHSFHIGNNSVLSSVVKRQCSCKNKTHLVIYAMPHIDTSQELSRIFTQVKFACSKISIILSLHGTYLNNMLPQQLSIIISGSFQTSIESPHDTTKDYLLLSLLTWV